MRELDALTVANHVGADTEGGEAIREHGIFQARDLGLSLLRRFERLEPVAEVIEKLADGDVAAARKGLGTVASEWARSIEPLLPDQ